MKRSFNIFLLLFFSVLYCQAQQEKVDAAVMHLQGGDLDRARQAIDSAVAHPETEKSAEAWYMRGYIYKDLHKKHDAATKGTRYRIESLNSFKKSNELDANNQVREENKKNLKVLASYFFNDAASSLDTTNYKKAIEFYALYKEALKEVDPNFDFKRKDIEFNLALASVYTRLYEAARKSRTDLLEKTKQIYLDILKTDPNNVSANYNMGILYYNQAVNIINEMDYDVDIFELSSTQDNTINLFKQSLPFMEKAYELDPNKKETLIGLSGIYFSLNEEEKSKTFKAKAEQIDQKK